MPVLAVIDAAAMAQTAGAVVLGLRDYGPVRMAGVVANRVASEGHAPDGARPRCATSRCWPRLPKQARTLPERHLGLVAAGRSRRHRRHPRRAGRPAAAGRGGLGRDRAARCRTTPLPDATGPAAAGREDGGDRARRRLLLPVSRQPGHAAKRSARTSRFFSPLADEPVPQDADAVYLPGGYPELHVAALAQAATLARLDPRGARGRPADPGRMRRHDGAGRSDRRQGRPQLADGRPAAGRR